LPHVQRILVYLFRRASKPSQHACRDGFKHTAACGDKLVHVLLAKGPDAVVDIDQACLAETMDMIGLFGFHYDFNAIRLALCLGTTHRPLSCCWLTLRAE